MDKKADVGLGVILIVILALGLISWIMEFNSRECNSNNDCDEEQYCGTDFSCHNVPVIEKEVVKRSWTLPLTIICITAIILAVIFNWDKIFSIKFGNKKPNVKGHGKEEAKAESPETYYNSQVQYTSRQ